MIRWIIVSDGGCRIEKLREDFAVSLAMQHVCTATCIDIITEKKAQEREAENRTVSPSPALLTPQSSTTSISNRSEEITIESQSRFSTHSPRPDGNGQITGSIGQYTPAATSKQLALQDSNYLDNDTELNSLGKDLMNGNYVLRPNSLPDSLPGADVLATRLEDLGVYATPAHTHTFSPGLLIPDNLDSALAGIDDIDYTNYSGVSSLCLQGSTSFNGGDGFLHDFMFVSQDSFNTFGNLVPQHQPPLHPLNTPILDTPVSQSPIQSSHTSQIDLTKSNDKSHEPTRSTSKSNKSRSQSISKRPKDQDVSDGDQECSDDGNEPEEGRPLLHIPVENGHEGIVRILLGNGADVNQQESSKGFTALHVAISHKHEAVLRLLIESGATLDIPDKLGRTPLHLAAEIGNEAGVRILLAHGADLSVKAGRNKRRSTK